MKKQITDQTILKSAAHLVAALLDPKQGVRVNELTPELQDSIDALKDELGVMLDPYRAGNGFSV